MSVLVSVLSILESVSSVEGVLSIMTGGLDIICNSLIRGEGLSYGERWHVEGTGVPVHAHCLRIHVQ